MRREGIAGTIVNVGSMAVLRKHALPRLPYAASKGALMSLSRNVAYAVMWDRIRVNHINPGWMDTPGEDVIQRRFHSDGKDWLEEAEARKPFGRLIKPDELAAAIAFLASDESGLMTGAVIEFDQSVRGAGHSGDSATRRDPQMTARPVTASKISADAVVDRTGDSAHRRRRQLAFGQRRDD